jgi:hypothetical protein
MNFEKTVYCFVKFHKSQQNKVAVFKLLYSFDKVDTHLGSSRVYYISIYEQDLCVFHDCARFLLFPFSY